MSKEKKEEDKMFDFEPNQPDRVVDLAQLDKLYKKSLVYLLKRNLKIMAEFLQISIVQWTLKDDIPTAALVQAPHSRKIIINVNFVLDIVCSALTPDNKWVHRDLNDPLDFETCADNLAGLLAHELMHSLLKHMRDYYTRYTPDPHLANAAQDAFINHMLVNVLGFKMEFSRAYLTNDMLDLLCPYVSSTEKDKNRIIEKLQGATATVKEVYDFILKNNPNYKEQIPSDQVVYIGSHSKEGNGNEKPEKGQGGALGQGQAATEEEGSMIRELNKSCSKFGQYFEDSILIEKNKSKELEKLLKKSEILKEIQGQVSRFCKNYSKGEMEYKSYKPTEEMSKTERILVADDQDVVWFRRTRGQTKTKAVLYVDVSGSIYDLVPALYGIIVKASEAFDLDIFLFSTELNDITLKELQKGVVKSTGGTDFDTWAKHMSDKPEYKAAIVITDGYGDCKQEYLDKIKSQGQILNCLLTDGGRMPDYIKRHCKYIWDLDLNGRN